MNFEKWLEFLGELSRITSSHELFNYDASPLRDMVFNIDGYEASESRLPWMTWSDWGWKAVIASISDVIASGGRPVAILYSLGGPSRDLILEVANGVGEASRWAGVRVLKADTNRSRHDIWIDVAVVGVALRPISRSGARRGELLVQIGPLGYGLVAGKALEGVIDISSYPKVKEYTRRPRIDVNLGLKLGECGVTAAIDNSDGWAATLYQLSKASGVKIELEELVAVPEAVRLLDDLGLGEEELLESWEDYNIAAVIPEQRVQCLLEYCKAVNLECRVVGRVEEGDGVYYRGKPVKVGGWTWF